ncbi:rRNA maturation RNase YbeY [Ectobacillus antri]|jgi:probable rRNA maturation factor|uniref:Endoribonuclease YbeY n=1 Tax=Ectobacillus antri TaxID=2486280 RepID=A0ABT6H4A3_9BACI|nr:rRNA maturation RNase YbeY [Ectobacillus antri]MDG4655493.1 rRNA maturation RNase YbeY [Ectobacillus antri]MDG5753251.1 rRNA maturation RNase YbeY [Ectobacillus antri]
MGIIVDFFDETNEVEEKHINMLQELIAFAAKSEKVEDAEMSVTFVTNERIQELNYEYRGKNQPTDVISFAMEEMGEGELEVMGGEEMRMLGDIVISVPRTKEQAEDYGHSFERELGFLTVHGLLHLLGYDHMTEEEEKVMFDKQKKILHAYGLKR